MPIRSKDEAELRMSMHVARLARQEGKSARDALEAVFKHLATAKMLKNSQPTEINDHCKTASSKEDETGNQ